MAFELVLRGTLGGYAHVTWGWVNHPKNVACSLGLFGDVGPPTAMSSWMAGCPPLLDVESRREILLESQIFQHRNIQSPKIDVETWCRNS